MHKEFLTPQFLLFLVSGGIAAAANFGSRMAYEYWLGLSYSMAIILAYFTGMVVAFSLFRFHVFEPSNNHIGKEILYFLIINGLAIVQTWVVSMGMAEYVLPLLSIETMRKEIAHATGVATPILSSYIGHKYLTFQK